MEEIRKEHFASLKDVPKAEWNNDENSKKWNARYQGMKEKAEYKKANAAYEQLQKDLAEFMEKGEGRLGNGPAIPHGFVWLYRRK